MDLSHSPEGRHCQDTAVDGGAEVPSKGGTDTVEPAVSAESLSCVEILNKGVGGCAMGVAAARASAESVPPSMGMVETEVKAVSAAGFGGVACALLLGLHSFNCTSSRVPGSMARPLEVWD